MILMSQPLVSVILPTYNRAHTLGRAIRSVLEQTYANFELIVVDDGSTDNTEEVVKSFADPRIRFLRHEHNRGVSAARNSGIKVAQGEYIAFNDSDDEWLPQKLKRQMEIFDKDKTGDIGLVLCELTKHTPTGKSRITPEMRLINYEDMLSRCGGYGIGTQQFLIKRDLTLPELHFNEYLPALEDWDLAFRLMRLCRIDYVPEVLVRTYDNGGPHANSKHNRLNAHLRILDKYADELKARPKMLARHHERIALSYFDLADMRQARHHLTEAIRAYPRRLVNYLYFLSTLFGRRGLRFCLAMRRNTTRLFRQIKT